MVRSFRALVCDAARLQMPTTDTIRVAVRARTNDYGVPGMKKGVHKQQPVVEKLKSGDSQHSTLPDYYHKRAESAGYEHAMTVMHPNKLHTNVYENPSTKESLHIWHNPKSHVVKLVRKFDKKNNVQSEGTGNSHLEKLLMSEAKNS